MRPMLAILIAVVILGGLQSYMHWRPRPRAYGVAAAAHATQGIFELQITLTFAVGPDPFALDLDSAESLVVTLAGREVLRETGTIAAGQTIRVSDIQGIVAGPNEIHVRAIPQDEDPDRMRALRLQLLRDNQPIAEQSLWSEPGQPVEGVILVNVPTGSAADEQDSVELVRDVAMDFR